MNYHWERLSPDHIVLFEEGAAKTRWIPMHGVAAEIIKLGSYLGSSSAKYGANGPLVDPPRDFDTEEEAISLAEGIVKAVGNTVDGS